MNQNNSRRLSVILFNVFTMLMLMFSSCGQDNITSQSKGVPLQPTEMSDNGPITLLTLPGNSQSNLWLLDTLFSIESLITRQLGGTLVTGDLWSGFSSIHFLPLDLPADTTISFQWIAGNTLEATFAPHGINFNNPVKLVLSYKNANLTASEENSLKIYYYNEDTEEWELVGGTVNKLTKTVTAYITHFSRYALARA